MLRSCFARVAASKEYSIIFRERDDGQYCVVRTWDENDLQSDCVQVEASGQRLHRSELSCLSRVVDSVASCQLPLAIEGRSASLRRVLNENRIDGRRFIIWQEFTVESFLQCFRQAHQAVFGMLEVTMVDYLMLRLRGVLQEPLLEDVCVLRRCVIAGRVKFSELRGVIEDLLSVWEFVRSFVRYTGAEHLQSSSDWVGRYHFRLFSLSSFFVFFW